MSYEGMQDVLTARFYLYSMTQALLGSKPTDKLFAGVDAAFLQEALELTGCDDAERTAGAVAGAMGKAEDQTGLYARLFLGPTKLACPPWESVYRSKRRALFQRSTLDVRNAYRAQGLLPQMYPRVADDHIALELGFLSALAQRTLEAIQAEDTPAARKAFEASKRFLDEHLSVWALAYADDLEKEAPDTLYALVARMAADFAARDVSLVGELLDELNAEMV